MQKFTTQNNIYTNELFLGAKYRENDIDPSRFYGDVLYVGLGSAYLYKNQSENVKSATFIEIDEKIIKEYGDGLDIIHIDAYKHKTDKKYDWIIIDIWDYPTDKENVYKLFNRYKKNCNKEENILFLKTIIKLY